MVRPVVESRALPWTDPRDVAALAFAVPLAVPGSAIPAQALRLTGDAYETCTGPPEELADFLVARRVIVADREAEERLAGVLARGARVVHLEGLAALLFPGRPRVAPVSTPEELLAATSALVERFLERPWEALALFAHAVESLHEGELSFAAALCEHPSRWLARTPLADGGLSRAHGAYASLEDALDEAEPAWTRAARARPAELLLRADDPVTLDASDRAAIDRLFAEHLPALLGTAERPSYRPGQHAVAARIARSFGERELLLVHAPTGTGKTLAYLVPTMLWAYRNGVRVGVATFTRALQSQAMERDVPLAREALAALGVPREEDRGVRVSVLKGRSNYLCWRALVQSLPPPEADLTDLLAWLALALFGLEDRDGDLDRFAGTPPLGTLERGAWREAVQRALRLVRAEPGCCTRDAERKTCGAEAARERAERSHVVLTNHAFALSRPEFFRHVVFDECEHLHAVAHDAFSHAISLRSLRDLLARLHRRSSGGGERALGRIAGLAIAGSALWAEASAAIGAHEDASRALASLADELVVFARWREEHLAAAPDESEATEDASRGPAAHALFRAYVESGAGAGLDGAHAALVAGLDGLALGCQRLVEELDRSPAHAAPRLRRSFDVLRRELLEALESVRAWIPRMDDGTARFGRAVFHDLERTSTGEFLLVARVLLPHEFLGRSTYPDLAGAVFLSATTWLRGGFETAALYLGLARAAAPDDDEEREPSRLETFRAEDPFDYSRVHVLVPKDAPSVKDKAAFLGYAAGFVTELAARTRGRMLVLFTNAEDLAAVARESSPALAAERLTFFWQGMEQNTKEELAELFRGSPDSVLFGLDTFWFGTDFPGRTLEVLVLVRLPYGVPDRYHEAQCAAIGTAEQRRAIYLPRALAKFRQGFGRLMRRESDHGCVFVLDRRILDPRHRAFLRELPLARATPAGSSDEPEGATPESERLARLVTLDTERAFDAALCHLESRREG
jgi:ATP-dependent DNA helicase DinG